MEDLKGNNENITVFFTFYLKMSFIALSIFFRIKYCLYIGFTALCFFLISCTHTGSAESKAAYTVDPAVKDEVAKKISSVNDIILGAIDYKLYENDSLIIDSHNTGKSGECFNMASLEGDTINITGFMGMFAGFGYTITLYKDTCIVRHFSKSDAEIYKLHKNDSLKFSVWVPCKSYSLTLAEKPGFKKGEVVQGIIELVSEDYYEAANGEERKYKMQLKSWFRTAPAENMEDAEKRAHEEEINKQ
jgi:hypothetical protein